MSDTKTKRAMRTSKTADMKHHSELIVPKEYKGPQKGEGIFTFSNFYIEYARFHRDETNKWIHMFFIPLICGTL
jgi:hypothetical protein